MFFRRASSTGMMARLSGSATPSGSWRRPPAVARWYSLRTQCPARSGRSAAPAGGSSAAGTAGSAAGRRAAVRQEAVQPRWSRSCGLVQAVDEGIDVFVRGRVIRSLDHVTAPVVLVHDELAGDPTAVSLRYQVGRDAGFRRTQYFAPGQGHVEGLLRMGVLVEVVDRCRAARCAPDLECDRLGVELVEDLARRAATE